MTIHTAALMAVSRFNFMPPWKGKTNRQPFMNMMAEAWKFYDIKLLFVSRVPALCIKLQPSANWMLPGSASLAAPKKNHDLALTNSKLSGAAGWLPSAKGRPKCWWKKKKKIPPFLWYGPVALLAPCDFSDLFFLMSLKLIFSHDCIPSERISKDFCMIAAVWWRG